MSKSPSSAKVVRRPRGRPTCDAAHGADALLRVARGTFARRGFEATSVREIGRLAGLDAALISHHFGSKEALWRAVVEQIAAQVDPLLSLAVELRADASLRPRERVDRALEQFIDQVFEDPDIGMFFSTATTEEGERLDALVDRLVRPFHAVFVPLLTDAMDAGELKRGDPLLLFSLLTQGISKTVAYAHVLRAVSPLPDDEARFKAELRRCVVNLLD